MGGIILSLCRRKFHKLWSCLARQEDLCGEESTLIPDREGIKTLSHLEVKQQRERHRMIIHLELLGLVISITRYTSLLFTNPRPCSYLSCFRTISWNRPPL
jgi:hypothetical protein